MFPDIFLLKSIELKDKRLQTLITSLHVHKLQRKPQVHGYKESEAIEKGRR
jgi:hypothetical protein